MTLTCTKTGRYWRFATYAAALAEALQRPEVKALAEAAEAVIRDFHGDNAIGVAHLTKLRAALKGVK